MKACLFVGLGGAAGAVLRYLFSLIPVKGQFPILTLLTNLIGAVVIGCIAAAAALVPGLPTNLILFLKTGLCGGFTTFSTFSLETMTLFQEKHVPMGIAYAVVSVLVCLVGVWVGQTVMGTVLRQTAG